MKKNWLMQVVVGRGYTSHTIKYTLCKLIKTEYYLKYEPMVFTFDCP